MHIKNDSQYNWLSKSGSQQWLISSCKYCSSWKKKKQATNPYIYVSIYILLQL